MNVDRVTGMETILNSCDEATAALSAQLDRMEALGDDMTALFAYYGSEDWFADREDEIPEGIKACVLSEDAVYDQITAVRDAAFRMLELATDILKNRI